MMTETEKLDQALTEADARKWRYKAEQAEAALARSEARLKLMQSEMDKIARNLGKEIELLARAEQAEAALNNLLTEFAFAQVVLATAGVTYTVNRGVGEALAMAQAEQAVDDYPDAGEPECEKCGVQMEWEGCWSCSGDGEHSLHEEDPLFYDEDDSEKCDVCDGDGGWWWCPSCRKTNSIEVQP